MKNYYNFAKAFAFLCASAISNLFNAQTYCNPTYSNSCANWRITQVSIPQANFNNTFASGTCTSGRDRTSVSMNLNTNTNYGVSVTTMGWMSCGLAIDFNKDGDFDDAGENLYMPNYIGNSSPETYTGSFTVPGSVTPGSYRMRIWTREANAQPGTSACGSYAYGTWTDYTANILGPLATSEVTKATAKIYPNPVSDILNIEDQSTIESVEIYDAGGKLTKTISSKGKNIAVKLSDLIPGVYTAKVKNDKDSQTVKFIKK
ncbi:T9SS type A sorting domain-containing protein [Chryseobacterium sp. MMS23-Vi53]|uniref:T9SS type A sorting domain-containing protein n=1 Tax=Chryseobacterium sp. MMS23-Vi53 TaxID=3386644 RepID=UPI0039ED18AF